MVRALKECTRKDFVMVLQLKKIKMENALRVFMQMVCGMAVFWKKTATGKIVAQGKYEHGRRIVD